MAGKLVLSSTTVYPFLGTTFITLNPDVPTFDLTSGELVCTGLEILISESPNDAFTGFFASFICQSDQLGFEAFVRLSDG